MEISKIMDELVYTTLRWRKDDVEHIVNEFYYYGVDISLLPEYVHKYTDITGEYIESIDIVYIGYHLIEETIFSELATVIDTDDFVDLIEIDSGGFTHARITPTDDFMFLCRDLDLTNLPVTRALYNKYN